MRTMGVKIREWKGAWWVFINFQGTRKAKRIGTGDTGKKAAKQVAQQIQARLALGQSAFDRQQAGVTIETYAETFLQRIEQTRKHTTHADYKKILDHDIFPLFGVRISNRSRGTRSKHWPLPPCNVACRRRPCKTSFGA
jgi:integrase